jgi:hypothetical protein
VSASKSDKDSDELAMVKATPQSDTGGSGGTVSLKAMGAYKNRDFVEAERLMRVEASQQPAKSGQRSIDVANQIKQLKGLVDTASAEEGKNPGAAIKAYDQAIALDARLARGALGGALRQRQGRAQLGYAQQTFAQGKFEETARAVQTAQKLGAGDGGMGKQLEVKAAELVQRGQSLAKSNPAQAKTLWRTVTKMVPASSPAFLQAYKLLNNTGTGKSDEDED